MNTARTTEGRAVDADEKMSIFRTWADSFLQVRNAPMDKITGQVFLALYIGEQAKQDVPTEIAETFQYKVLEKRAKYVGLNINPHATAFIASICRSPGELVMYCYALKHWQMIHKELISIATISSIFPTGFPDSSDLEDLWDQQKVGVGNLLDNISAVDFNEAGQDQSTVSAA